MYVIRIANPGSDMDHVIEIFKKIYAQLSDYSSFNLDNMAEVMTSAKMASSKGYVGDEALKRSYAIKDTSRNPLYNQAKMYAEVYRMLGWMNSVDKALEFKFTLLGANVALSGDSAKYVLELCLLGIHFSNELLDVDFKNEGSPFVSILRYFNELDGILCRDEIILGALNLNNTENGEEFNKSVILIKELRSSKDSKTAINAELNKLSEELKIKVVTMENYTRIIISVLKYMGWVKEIKKPIYGKSRKFFEITEYGKETYNKISDLKILTFKDLETYSEMQINAICKIGFLKFLEMANFSVGEDLKLLNEETEIVKEIFNGLDIFFNPFQSYSRINILKYFPEESLDEGIKIKKEFFVEELGESEGLSKKVVEIHSKDANNFTSGKTAKKLLEQLKDYNNDEKVVISNLMEEILTMKQTEFYPLVAGLFEIIFQQKTEVPQSGVNNNRIDVVIPDVNYSIPVEVKSPTEERMLSVKAIRQALENKIILLSRKNYNTSKSIATLAVGYSIPNDRSEVYLLIEEIKKSFDINIAITSIDILLDTAIKCLKNGKKYMIEDFKDVNGVIKFEDL